MKRSGWIGLSVALLIVGGGAAWIFRGGKEEVKFRTATVDKGNITQRISATGTINALIQVPVGTQVSGVVTALYADYNSLVKRGQVVAQIDPTPWLTALRQAEAGRQGAQATLVTATADYRRNKRLWDSKLLSDADLDIKDLAMKTAAANLDSARATVTKARTDLGYCTLKAPVDGVVVSRLVDVGQTVAASFSTPSVFTIAQDLSKMKVQAAIDEADIGQVKVGQMAFFTVDSYPDKQFRGLVTEVQLNPIVTSNVVTYTVVMEVTNEPRTTFVPDAPLPSGSGQGAQGREAGQGGHRGHGGEARPGGQAGRDHGDAGQRSDPAWQAQRAAGGPAGQAQRTEGRTAGQSQRAPGAPAGKPETKAAPGAAESQVATLETATARYIPAGSPVYKCSLALFPGMTANCTIITNRRQDAVRVPAVALRFNPGAYLKDPERKSGAARMPGSANLSKGMVARRDDHVWVLERGKPKSLAVKVGVSDGQYTEISGEGVSEGLVVLTGLDDAGKKPAGVSASPLAAGPGGPRH